jgi:hypothetical protein
MMDLPSLMIIGAIILIILFLQHKGKGDEKWVSTTNQIQMMWTVI